MIVVPKASGLCIHLNEVEQRLAIFAGRKRQQTNERNGNADMKVGPESGEQYSIDGVGGEIAAARALNVYPDLTIGPHPDFDLVTRFGHQVDVKATRRLDGRLFAAHWKRQKPAQWYLLVIGQCPVEEGLDASYRMIGFMSGKDLAVPERIQEIRHVPTLVAEQSELIPFDVWRVQYD